MKKIIFEIIRFKPINIFVVAFFLLIKTIFKLNKDSRINRIPVNKQFKVYADDVYSFTFVNNGFDSIANSIYWSGFKYYETETMPVFIRLIRNSKVFFDIGANTGLFSLVAESVNKNIEIYAFEPEPRSFLALRRNFERNNRNIHLYDFALSSQNGFMKFYIGSALTIPTGSSLSQDVHLSETKKIKYVETIRLDDFVYEYKISNMSLLKIDTEGSEFNVLSGAIKSIKRFNPMILCEVFYNRSEEQLHELLMKLDYVCFHLIDKGICKQEKLEGDKNWKLLNYLFVSKSNLNKFVKEFDVIQ